MTVPNTFGGVIRELRQRQGLTQEQLAERSPDLTQTFVSQVEGNRVGRPSSEKMRSLATALGVPFNWLMGQWLTAQEGYDDESAADAAAEVKTAVERDLLDFAKDRPDLMQTIKELREQNTEDVYQDALLIIHRHIISGIETARDVLAHAKQRG